MSGKINGEGIAGPVPIIQAPGETIICRRCGERKDRYKQDFPFCFECYQELVRRGEMVDV